MMLHESVFQVQPETPGTVVSEEDAATGMPEPPPSHPVLAKVEEKDTEIVAPKNLFQASRASAAAVEKEEQDQQPELHHGVRVDLDHMKNAVFFLHDDKRQRLTKFWMLLVLAAIIASSGIASDSTATVIGAMIVAPLMTPILGTMLAIVLTLRRNLLVSLFLVITGSASCFLIGFVYGFIVGDDIIAPENNSQVSGRVQPKIPDLIGALATGIVGAVALVRRDIADALPGVAISISLVPPICVSGMMASSKRWADCGGAMLLFSTNVMSIWVMGIFTMYFYRVHLLAAKERARSRGLMAIILTGLLCMIAVPLGFTSFRIHTELEAEACVKDVLGAWASPYGWKPTFVTAKIQGNKLMASAAIAGPPPFPDDYSELTLEELHLTCPTIDIMSFSFFPRTTYPEGVDPDEL